MTKFYVSVLARPHHSMFVNHGHVYTAAWRRGHNQWIKATKRLLPSDQNKVPTLQLWMRLLRCMYRASQQVSQKAESICLENSDVSNWPGPVASEERFVTRFVTCDKQAFSLDRMEAPAQWAITWTVTSISPKSIMLLYCTLGGASSEQEICFALIHLDWETHNVYNHMKSLFQMAVKRGSWWKLKTVFWKTQPKTLLQ
jgi:hypothetical protein